MPKIGQKGLNQQDRIRLIKQLEELGKAWWIARWREHIAIPSGLDPNSADKQEREKILRYAVLRTIINQQADAAKARELPRSLYGEFGDRLLFDPRNLPFRSVAEAMRNVAGPKGRALYHVGSLGGIKPLSLFLYRFAAFGNFVASLNGNLYDTVHEILTQEDGVTKLHERLRDDPDLEAGWVGNDPKACRMLVDWIVFLFDELWRVPIRASLEKSLMIVDGHVAKVFVRAGLLDTVNQYKRGSSIIYAVKMRPEIELLVGSVHGVVPFYVDDGAFSLIATEFDTDLAPKCEVCPITETCLKHKYWTAYKESDLTPPEETVKRKTRQSRKAKGSSRSFEIDEEE